jgi:hypothetical protein
MTLQAGPLPADLSQAVCSRMAEHMGRDKYTFEGCQAEISTISGRRAFLVRYVARVAGDSLERYEIRTFVVPGDRADVVFVMLTPFVLAEATRPTIDAIIASIEIGESI